MKAAIIHAYGETPQYGDIKQPEHPKDGQAIVSVNAASIKNLDKGIVAGKHYSKPYENFPAVVGLDGIGTMEDGERVYAQAIAPYGMMAEYALINKKTAIQIPDNVDDVTAAALPNPALSAWFSLAWRAALRPGETVFILGATGVTGKIAIQLAKAQGAGKIIAAGRNEAVLETLQELGADETVSLKGSDAEIHARIQHQKSKHPFDVVLDYVWGVPAEILLDVLTGHDLHAVAHRTRYVQIGEMAGPVIRLSAAALRSNSLELYGVGAGSVPKEVLQEAFTCTLPELFQLAAIGKLKIDTAPVKLKDIASAWNSAEQAGKRMVVIP
ncbi:zinc-binding alcohol dehydrogenase family protein [Chitinophaga sp. Hz27]|uniref:quinone oxidoreductase family protein n=1 Tax=Chitinophaga sp. Hz27 TaxID=3347169 RepID=UPI0035E35FAC